MDFQSVVYPRMRTLVLQTMDFQSIVVDFQRLAAVKNSGSSLDRVGYRL